MRSLKLDHRLLDNRPSKRSFGLPMPRRHFLFSGLLAFGVSLGVHYAAFTYAEFHFTNLGEMEEDATPREMVELQNEDPALLDRKTIDETFGPADPETVLPEASPLDPLAGPVEATELEPPPPVDLGDLVEGLNTATAQPAAPPIDTLVGARQELLQIDQAVHAEDVITVPREFEAAVPRAIRAPDISLPANLPDFDSLQRATAPTPAPVAAPALPRMPLDDITALSPPSLDELLPGISLPPGGGPGGVAANIQRERPEEVTEHRAVENLLDLDVSRYVSPDDPDTLYFKVVIERAAQSGIPAGPAVVAPAPRTPGAVAPALGTARGATPFLPVLPKSVVLMQDCSMSIGEGKLDLFKKGLSAWIDRIQPGDYFNIIAFSDGVDTCFDDLVPMNARHRATAKWYARGLKLQGKTDVFASLQRLLQMVEQSPVPVIGILLTDGRPTTGLLDSTDIIETFTRQGEGRLSVFSVGGGSRANEYLLDLLSYRNRGDSIVVPDSTDLPRAMGEMAGQLENPVLANLRYSFTGTVAPEVYPGTLTHLYLGRPLEIYGKMPRGAGKLAFQVIGTSLRNRTHDMVFEVDPETGGNGDPAIMRQWAWHKMYHLIGNYLKDRDEASLRNIRLMAARYGLRVPYMYDAQGRHAPVGRFPDPSAVPPAAPPPVIQPVPLP